jgi:multidrug efflux pump
MQLAETSIRRPVLAVVMSLLILLIGAVSFDRLSVREYPKIDEPTVTVSVKYPGASAEVIARRLDCRHRCGGRDHLHQPR